jgi:hypothetical protein
MATHILSVRRIAGVLLPTLFSTLLAGLLLGATASPASAEDGFRYWNYFHLQDGAFVFAQTGPGDYTPKDGDVEGWRYGTSTISQGLPPRANLDRLDFDAVCGDAEAAEGEKRVAVLIDYGTRADAPKGAEVPGPVAECAVVPADATGQQTLQAVADVRADGAMLCGINGYPAQGCGEPVKNADVATNEQPVEFEVAGGQAEREDDSSGSMAAVVAAVLVVVIGGGGLLVNRRRSHEQD